MNVENDGGIEPSLKTEGQGAYIHQVTKIYSNYDDVMWLTFTWYGTN